MFDPQGPLLAWPQELTFASLAPLVGLLAAEVDRSLLFEGALRPSFPEKLWPFPSADSEGVPERLLFGARVVAWDCAGRVPIGATPGAEVLPGRGGEPPGEEVDVRLDCWAAVSKRPKDWLWGLEAGEEVLSARERCWGWGLGDGPLDCWVCSLEMSCCAPCSFMADVWDWLCPPMEKGSYVRGDGPRKPAVLAFPEAGFEARGVWLSSLKPPLLLPS